MAPARACIGVDVEPLYVAPARAASPVEPLDVAPARACIGSFLKPHDGKSLLHYSASDLDEGADVQSGKDYTGSQLAKAQETRDSKSASEPALP